MEKASEESIQKLASKNFRNQSLDFFEWKKQEKAALCRPEFVSRDR